MCPRWEWNVGSVLKLVCDSRSPCKCAWSHSAWRGVDGVEPSCVQPWPGWTVARGSNAPSVINSMKVRSRTGKLKQNSWSPNLQSNLSVGANHQSCSNFTTLESKKFEFKFSFFCSSVPWQHYQPTNGVEGARVDRNKRPELSMGSYEILTSQQVQFT